MRNRIKAYIGDRAFYKMVLAIVLPIIIQNSITNFVSLLDNLMVGRLGTDQMSGVAIANQLFFVFNITVFGAVSGAGIFAAQFFGARDHEGVRSAFRYKFLLSIAISLLVIALLCCFDAPIIRLFLNESSDLERVNATLDYGLQYVKIMLIGLPPFAIVQCYASTLREVGETKLPMLASLMSMFVNLVFNYFLIFGRLGFPELGVRGAAYATVLSRFVELGILLLYTHSHTDNYAFARKLFKTLKVPVGLAKSFTLCGIPLLANELLWALGQTTLMQTWSLRGLDTVAALNITYTVFNVATAAFLSMGSAAAILIGQSLGANDIQKARSDVKKITAFAMSMALVIGIVVFIISSFIPLLYQTSDSVRSLATILIRIICIVMPGTSCANCCYFIIRSGGKTGITFLFDTGFSWTVCVPLAMILIRFTNTPLINAYVYVQLCDYLKSVIGIIMIKKGVWIHNIVSSQALNE